MPNNIENKIGPLYLDLLKSIKVMLLIFAIISVVIYGFISEKNLYTLFNADNLLPTDLFWNVSHRPFGWFSFQQPRIISLIPDQAIAFWLGSLGLPWRVAEIGQVICLAGLLTFAARKAIASLYPKTRHGAGFFWVIFSTIALCFLSLSQDGEVYIYGLLPLNHAGPLIASIWMVTWAKLERLKSHTLSFAFICFLGCFCDALFLAEVGVPLALAYAWESLTSQNRKLSVDWGRLGPVVISILMGLFSSSLVFKQPYPKIPPINYLRDVWVFIKYSVSSPILLLLIALSVVTIILQARRLVIPTIRDQKHALNPIERLIRRFGFQFDTTQSPQWVYVIATMGASLGILALLFETRSTLRYGMPFFFWPLVLAAGWSECKIQVMTSQWIGYRKLWLMIIFPMSLIGLSLGVAALHAWSIPALAWRQPIESCLSRLLPVSDRNAGLADYWLARPMTLSSNFRLQVQPINNEGQPSLWGNDPYWFTHSITSPSQVPTYSFIVMAQLSPTAIAARYGRPDQSFKCLGSDIWIYHNGTRLTQSIIANAKLLNN